MSETQGEKAIGSRNSMSRFPWHLYLSACLLVILTLGISFSLIYRNSMRLIQEDAWVGHTHRVIANVESLLGAMIDIETGQRGFVIAGDRTFLEPFESGKRKAQQKLQEIRHLTSDNERQKVFLAEIEPLIIRKLQFTEQTIQVREKKGAAAASSLIASGEGKRAMDLIREKIDQMLAEENRLLHLRSDASRNRAEQTNLQFIAISLIDILMTSFALWIIYRNTRKRLRSESMLVEKQEQYVNEARAAARAGEQARVATEQAALFKEQLLANAFHELRTPLTAILGFSEDLKSSKNLDTQTRQAFEAIHRNSTRLMSLVENLLQSAEALGRGDPPPSEPIYILPLLRLALQRLQPAMDAKGIQLQFEEIDTNPKVLFNAERFRMSMEQLFDNAIKFSSSGGKIQIKIQTTDSHAQIEVIDDGIGISKELMPKLFRAFHQGDASLVRAHEGLGAGLFVSRFLIETYGGTLKAESEGPNRGARFTVTLPLTDKEKPRTSTEVPWQMDPS